jgi:ketosteroid isomerase-like protein
VYLLAVLALLASACASASDQAARAVEQYLTALVNKDADRLAAISCADWESSALLEFDSLQAVETRLEGLACSISGTDGDRTLVSCQGKIIATYNDEDQELDISVRTYEVIEQGGESLVCGYR